MARVVFILAGIGNKKQQLQNTIDEKKS